MRRSAIALSVIALNGIGPALDGGAKAASSTRLPTNYRQLIANYIKAYVRTHPNYVMINPMITQYETWGGLLHGGTITIVCVHMDSKNGLGTPGQDGWIITFEDGQLKRTQPRFQ
jgi:hypothetical protein